MVLNHRITFKIDNEIKKLVSQMHEKYCPDLNLSVLDRAIYLFGLAKVQDKLLNADQIKFQSIQGLTQFDFKK